jgi:hypothetical protein
MERSKCGPGAALLAFFHQELATMSRRKWIVAVAVLIFVSPLRAEQPPDSKRVKALIAQLGSRDFHEREEATQLLITAGLPALEYLHLATTSSDAEIRRRAREAVEQIEKKIETTRLLTPQRVHLIYRDTPVADAVADFAKKSGYPVQLDDPARMANRKMTLDTGDVSFWEALDHLCRTASLIERRALPPANQNTQGMSPQEMERRLWEKRMLIRRGLTVPPARVDFGKIVLIEGKQDNLPTVYLGGVRIRAMSANTPIPGHGVSPEESYVVLDVAAEPSIDWRGVLGVHVQKAMDPECRQVAQAQESMPHVNSADDLNAMGGAMGAVAFKINVNNGVMFAASDFDNPANSSNSPAREFPIRFKRNGRDMKQLREIDGILFARVQTPHGPLIQADKILQAEGKTFKGPEDSYLKIHEARQNDSGQVHMRLTLRAPSMSDDALGMMGGAIFVRRFNGRMAFMAQHESENIAAQNLALQDSKGGAFQLASSEETTQVNGAEVTQEFRLIFQGRQGLEPPARFVYSGHRLVTVEIPFALKNVPLKE